METKYTDGPWYTSVYPGGDIGICQDDGNGHDICIVVDRQKNNPKDNAKLISSAPDLLQAAQIGLNYIEYCKGKGMTGEIDNDIRTMIEAIDRATGE